MFQTDTMDNIDSIEWAEGNVTSLLVIQNLAKNLTFQNQLLCIMSHTSIMLQIIQNCYDNEQASVTLTTFQMEDMPACSLCHNITTDNCYHTGPSNNKFKKLLVKIY